MNNNLDILKQMFPYEVGDEFYWKNDDDALKKVVVLRIKGINYLRQEVIYVALNDNSKESNLRSRPFSSFLSRTTFIQKDNRKVIEKIIEVEKEVIKEVKVTEEVEVIKEIPVITEFFTETWIDRLYRHYCIWKSRKTKDQFV